MSDFMEAAMPIMQYFYQRCPCCHALAYAQTELISCPICAVRGRGLTPEMQSINHLQFAEEAQATIARQSEALAESESRCTALAARVEALENEIRQHMDGLSCGLCDEETDALMASTPAADLSAHDDRIRREALEEAARKITFWLTNRFTVSEYKLASPFDIKAWVEIIILPHSGEKGEGG